VTVPLETHSEELRRDAEELRATAQLLEKSLALEMKISRNGAKSAK
jgi:hypothetical protein